MSTSPTVLTQQKVVFILIDGVGDVSLHSVAGSQTPLSLSHTPHLTLLSTYGVTGLLDSVESGLSCGSDTAHLSILGYDPLIYYRGRGAFESMGSGMEMIPGDIAFKSNFATLSPQIDPQTNQPIVKKRRCDRAFPQWGLPLIDAVDNVSLPSFPHIQVSVKYATEHRCGVRIRGTHNGIPLTDHITGTDPLKDNLPLVACKPIQIPAQPIPSPESILTSDVVNELSNRFHQVLKDHPINQCRCREKKNPGDIILLRGAGACLNVPTFHSLFQLQPFMIAPTAIIAGLGKSLHMTHIKVKEATGDYHTNLNAKGTKLVQVFTRAHSTSKKAPSSSNASPSSSVSTSASSSSSSSSSSPRSEDAPPENDFDFGFLHIKAVDDAGHDRDLGKKIQFIQKSDEMIGEIMKRLYKHNEEQKQKQLHLWQEYQQKLSLLSHTQVHAPVIVDTQYTFVVTGDHSTPIMYGDHSFEPVPFVMCALHHALPNIHEIATPSSSTLLKFDEQQCATGVLGRFPGREVMPLIKNFMNILKEEADDTIKTTVPLSQIRARI